MKKYRFVLPLALLAACNSGEQTTTTEIIEPAAKVFEYTPAPGQFIGDPATGSDRITTPEQACTYAEGRLREGLFVSLGGWGGYIVAGFGSPVKADGGSELLVKGNPIASSSEPGVVWVMQDANGNSLPDDEWYMLRGSEHDNPATKHNYTIEYTRPAADNSPVAWKDNQGGEGTIDRMGEHAQPSYFPAWIDGQTVSFNGICLPPNVRQGDIEGEGQGWICDSFAWGYADNYTPRDMLRGYNRFSIANAVAADGKAANLSRIDFIMVQTGVNAKAPAIGELSTEVCGIACRRTVVQ